MRLGRILGAAVVVCSLVTGAIVIACKDNSPSPPPAVNQSLTDSITIGAVLSLNGSLNYLGGPEQLGMHVALTQVNALGGVRGKSLNVVVIDDTTDPTTSNNAFATLIGDAGAGAIIGPTGSPEAVIAGPTVFAAQVIQISPSASTPQMTDAQPAHDRFFFRTAASHALQAKALARWMVKGPPAGAFGCRKPAVIYQDDAFGAPIAAAFATAVPLQPVDGGTATVPVSIKVPSAAKNSYSDEVQQVLSSGADCQLLVLFQPLGKQYVIDWVKATQGNPIYTPDKFITLGCNALQSDAFLSSTRTNPADPKSPTAAEGMFVLNFDTNPATPEYGDFKNLYTAAYPLAAGTDVSPYVANTYDALILIALAIEQAGGTSDKLKLRDALFAVSKGGTSYGPAQVGEALADIRAGKDIDYKGASGDVDFDDFGDVLQDFVVYSITSGAFQLLERIKSSTL